MFSSFSFILLWCYVPSKDGRLLVYEHTQGSYWSNSLDFLMENKSICQQQKKKPRKQPRSAAVQQTNIHPFILHSGHHRLFSDFVSLILWLCLPLSISPSMSDKGALMKGLLGKFCIWSLLTVLSLSCSHMTLSESPAIVTVCLYWNLEHHQSSVIESCWCLWKAASLFNWIQYFLTVQISGFLSQRQ